MLDEYTRRITNPLRIFVRLYVCYIDFIGLASNVNRVRIIYGR